ncbi:MAG TPA: glucose 1-dehydrogenase [Spirochaetota bacterium]|jgi:gluconate 5-dehydrogenase|nr:glucose 1-dehydrogenase [Spirochaetota bacterium]OQA99597.1 MAG: Rhamnolipids biosynthesis 3-oxoacyl-(acyl-carrier-protein) reductase [Spirochaetes bacterium ADurb.Bin218]HOK03141.1 glucose 1-dehydrogenase [Spirochaetota bacterium]HOK91722.1 glucose 1-dehydrogenase [Spirochaetota bacterium]HON15844.1 glucose 1-dehydrogenase [Spirochaetota bacterium]
MKVNEMFSLKGKVAIVTGGGRGIGEFISTGLAEAGADLVLASRKVENCEEVGKRLADENGINYLAVKCDLAVKEDVEKLVDEAMARFGRIDILVNNAGVTWGAPTLDYPLEGWDKIFNVNVRGVWILTQKVARIMKEQGGGKIINISSIFGSRGSLEIAHPAVAYNSSKAAIEVLTKNLAVKLADHKIYVNCIAPGFFHTDMMGYVFKPGMENMLNAMLSVIPLKKAGEIDDIKGLAVFLASKASDYMTGAVIPLDGGMAAK